jgi:hypothetical protein
MNEAIFEQISKEQKAADEFLPLLFSEKDDVLIVLKIHLLAENLVDAWVCSFAGKVDFLNAPVKLNFSFSQKLKLARNMGLPDELFKVVSEINKLRNKMAHDLSKKKIEEEDIKIISRPLEEYEYRFTKPENVAFTNPGNNRDRMGSSYTPNYMKLCIIYFVIQIEFPGVFIPKSDDSIVSEQNRTLTIELNNTIIRT